MYASYYGSGYQHPASGPPPPHQHPPAPPAGPQSNIVCANCTTLLLYPQGAQNVRCARCGEITPVPLTGGNSAQLTCNNPHCRVTLQYPRGASQVQCSLCNTINTAMDANQIGHIVCSCCQITLMYAFGAASVKCAVCNTVTQVNHSPLTQPPAQHGPSSGSIGDSAGASRRPQQSHQTVVIVNPPTLDEEGNEVEDYVVGVTTTPGQRSVEQNTKSRLPARQPPPDSLI
ncbi:hypothetical protein WJX77_012306 [Trebouxia sp. C0004]